MQIAVLLVVFGAFRHTLTFPYKVNTAFHIRCQWMSSKCYLPSRGHDTASRLFSIADVLIPVKSKLLTFARKSKCSIFTQRFELTSITLQSVPLCNCASQTLTESWLVWRDYLSILRSLLLWIFPLFWVNTKCSHVVCLHFLSLWLYTQRRISHQSQTGDFKPLCVTFFTWPRHRII